MRNPTYLAGAFAAGVLALLAPPALADGLHITYPPNGHQTSSESIFFVGTAAAGGSVTFNGQAVHRSPAGHFAPKYPLRLGENTFAIRHGGQTFAWRVTRKPGPEPVVGAGGFAPDAFEPASDLTVQPGEPVTFSAVASPGATVMLVIGSRALTLAPQPSLSLLPDNKASLTGTNQPVASSAVRYSATTTFQASGNLGKPLYRAMLGGNTKVWTSPAAIAVAKSEQPEVVVITAFEAVARSGPSTDFSRLTPLPKGTRAAVTGRSGDWLRLAHGAWVSADETRPVPGGVLPRTIVRSLRAKVKDGLTEVSIPLQQPVPLSVDEGDGTLTLSLYGATAQTDVIRFDDDSLVRRLDWSQPTPGRIDYRFRLKTSQAWGWTTRYEGTTLVLALKHPPVPDGRNGRLDGLRVVLDPGHGGRSDQGTHGPDGTCEKDLTLRQSQAVVGELEARGATVFRTRTADVELGLKERQEAIARFAPHVSISLHYNALPDQGDAENTRGVGAFWYNPQAHSLAKALHDALTGELARPSYGIWWDNLALTRPTVAPSVLMELGFLTNPEDFELCADPNNDKRVAVAIANGLQNWLAAPRGD